MMKRIILGVVGLSILLGAITLFRTSDPKPASEQATKTSSQSITQKILSKIGIGGSSSEVQDIPRIAVEAEPAKEGSITQKITSVGTLVANQFVAIKPEVHGLITKVHFKSGTEVPQGALLVEIDATDYKAALKQAEAKLKNARSLYERINSLHEKKYIPAKTYDDTLSQLHQAEAEYDVQKKRVERTIIRAPFEGVLGLHDVGIGTFVSEQKEILTIVDIEPLKIDFTIPASYIQKVKIGQNIEVVVDGFPDRTFTAIIEAIDSRVDSAAHSLTIRALIPNKDRTLKPGLFARVNVVVGAKENAVLVPESAVDGNGESEWVFKIVNDKANKVTIQSGAHENNQVEITHGIRPGEMIITAGQVKIRSGYPVRVLAPGTIAALQAPPPQLEMNTPEPTESFLKNSVAPKKKEEGFNFLKASKRKRLEETIMAEEKPQSDSKDVEQTDLKKKK